MPSFIGKDWLRVAIDPYLRIIKAEITRANDMKALSTVTQNANYDTTIDARLSETATVPTGGISGSHGYNFTSDVNSFKARQAGTIESGLIALGSTTISGSSVSKSVTGDTWNSAFYSNTPLDPVSGFMVSVLVESVTGTIREMFGVDSNPTENSSYNTIDFACYQVNGNFYSRVYQSGVSMTHETGNIALVVGDRIGVQIVNRRVKYFVLRTNGDIEYTSTNNDYAKATEYYIRGAMNRGTTSSGASVMGDVMIHDTAFIENKSVNIIGMATELVSEYDKEVLFNRLGIEVSSSSTYDLMHIRRPISHVTESGSGVFPVDMNHRYYTNGAQDINTVQFTA